MPEQGRADAESLREICLRRFSRDYIYPDTHEVAVCEAFLSAR